MDNSTPDAADRRIASLEPPAHYFPPGNGRYEVKPGLSKLDTDFGNGGADGRVFQIDRDWPLYRRAKLDARGEQLTKYYTTGASLSPHARCALVESIILRLREEYSELFQLRRLTGGGYSLDCRLSGERLLFDEGLVLVEAEPVASAAPEPVPSYVDALDALACQVQEDITLTEVDCEQRDRVTALHVCLPNYWAPEDKTGTSFVTIHDPVPGFERIARQAPALVEAMITRGPFVRFTWGLTTDARLNHHPHPPAGHPRPVAWHGRRFDPDNPSLYLRVERQTSDGLPAARACMFTIRTYLKPVTALAPREVGALIQSVESMPEDSLQYKGLHADRGAILSWLQTLSPDLPRHA